MKSYQLAAAVLTALTATAAQAEEVTIINYKEKTMCVPVQNYEGTITIMALCDASKVNTQAKLKLKADGCAVVGQQLEADGNGDIYEQAVMTIWGETDADIQKQSLPACENYDAAIYWVEL